LFDMATARPPFLATDGSTRSQQACLHHLIHEGNISVLSTGSAWTPFSVGHRQGPAASSSHALLVVLGTVDATLLCLAWVLASWRLKVRPLCCKECSGTAVPHSSNGCCVMVGSGNQRGSCTVVCSTATPGRKASQPMHQDKAFECYTQGVLPVRANANSLPRGQALCNE
jgi:hypothetical protein